MNFELLHRRIAKVISGRVSKRPQGNKSKRILRKGISEGSPGKIS